MIKLFCTTVMLACIGTAQAQGKINKIITLKEVTRIETTLSSDAMQGRASFTPGSEKAATFIAGEMKKAKLKTFGNGKSYLQTFSMVQNSIETAEATVNGQPIAATKVICISSSPSLQLNESSGYTIVRVKAGENLMKHVGPLLNSKENLVVLIDTSFAKNFSSLKRFSSRPRFAQNNNLLFLLAGNTDASRFTIHIKQNIQQKQLSNVVGVLPGKTQPQEYVIFSAHYDHLGFGKPSAGGDSLYNGANDDAAGTTAMLMLARYYKKLNNNARTLVFTAFAAEEIGGYGSQYFSNQLNPDQVAAMFNIEMIGTQSKWGTNSAYITGYDKTNMGDILEKNLQGSRFKFYPDPYPKEDLFYRSDNATLARKGVPAHTISTSKMDSEKYYHTPDDEIETLDLKNMTEIIKAIAISAQSIVSGKDSPTRVDTQQLK